MPTTQTLTVTSENLLRGDRIPHQLGHATVAIVSRVVLRNTRGDLHLTDGRMVGIRRDLEWTVEREVPTEEETLAERRAWSEERFTTLIEQDAAASPAETLTTAAANATVGRAAFTYSTLTDVLERQAIQMLGLTVTAALARLRENDPDASIFRAVAYVIGQGTNRSPVNPLSRSTSTTSNLLEDMDRWAIARLQDKLLWDDAGRFVQAELAALAERSGW